MDHDDTNLAVKGEYDDMFMIIESGVWWHGGCSRWSM